MAKMGRPRKNDVEGVNKAIDELIADYIHNDVLPTDYRLMDKLSISSRTLDRFYEGYFDRKDGFNENDDVNLDVDDKSTKETYVGAVKRLIEFRRQICVDNLAKSKQGQTGWIFLSKQPRWGGFQDVQRTESKGEQKLEIIIKDHNGKPVNMQ